MAVLNVSLLYFSFAFFTLDDFTDAEPCTSCDILEVCGGHCLYANLTKRWNQGHYNLVCNSVRSLIDRVAEIMPRVNRLLKSGKLGKQDFSFLKYNGCEIIP